ncbi:hypothetical protein BXT84_01705 [Sulfobacillus thermotolerans]|uniref:Glutamate synthase domain-containing protein n=1 Tax=Sulfobacillus thermotolerans TaxID=338644 RepID=A0ABM6RND8_9FIRM|nr:hypothetical protein BXT84_01705 [Sulfobacillus thermotolerans]
MRVRFVLIVGLCVILATLIAIAAALVGTRLLARRVEHLLGSSPRTSILELFYSLQAWSWREIILTMRRAQSGKVAEHPMDSFVLSPSLLDQLAFDPATFHPNAHPHTHNISLTTQIGPRAKRPLTLRLPVLIAPMGYGIGLAADTKLALAQISSVIGTAASSGEGPFLPEERAYAQRWILQWSKGPWNHSRAVIKLADAIEIHLGQGAEAEIAVHKTHHLPRRLKRMAGQHQIVFHSGIPRDFFRLVPYLRRINPDVPIGVKIPASQHLEADLAILTALSLDFITIDGSEAGSAGSPAVISDHFGIPTASAVKRARDWLISRHIEGVSLIASGGAKGAADIAKLLALGADAVDVGSAILFAMSHGQVERLVPTFFQGPSALVFADSPKHRHPRLDIGQAVLHGTHWFEATAQELQVILQALGLGDVHNLSRQALIARTLEAQTLLELPTSQHVPGESGLSQQVSSLATEYQRLLTSLTEQFALLTSPRSVHRHA